MIDVRCPLCKNRYSCKQMGMIPFENCGMFVIDDTIKRHKTNADCIRQWSDEEIAEFTIGVMDGAFELFTGAKMPDEKRRAMKTEWIDWLRKEVGDDNNS